MFSFKTGKSICKEDPVRHMPDTFPSGGIEDGTKGIS